MHDYSEQRRELEEAIMNKNIDYEERKNTIMRIVPEFKACNECNQEHPAHDYYVLDHIMKVVDGIADDTNNVFIVKLAALFHDIAKPTTKSKKDGVAHFYNHPEEGAKLTQWILMELGFDEDIISKVVCMVRYHDTNIAEDYLMVKEVVRIIGTTNIDGFKRLQISDLNAHADWYMQKHMIQLMKAHDELSQMI